MGKHATTCRALVPRYLGRPWSLRDGKTPSVIDNAARRLDIVVPAVVRDFYSTVGNVPEFCSIHNYILSPTKWEVYDGFLVFAEENQCVVSWGIKKRDLRRSDPPTWQHNTQADEWYPEDKAFLAHMVSMFDWYESIGVFAPLKK